MEAKTIPSLSLALSVIYFFSLPYLATASFIPPDNYLISCGSSANVTVDNRPFVGDSTHPSSVSLSSDNSISLSNPNPPSNSSPLSKTARVFSSASSYEFSIKENGNHLVRLHFFPFNSPNYNLNNANFSVSANGLSILRNFGNGSSVIKEFVMVVNVSKFEVCFVPTNQSGFGFVNAIEVFSAPDDLLFKYQANLIGPNGDVKLIDLMSGQILETVHRINVGGPKLTPLSDTLWRTWIPDEDFLVLKSAATIVRTTDPPNYQAGGASKEIAPDIVYMTAQQMNRDYSSAASTFNITWGFPVGSGVARYFVRLHFCDIVSTSLNQLYFNVFINGFLAKDLDLSTLTKGLLASPYYLDCVVDSDESGVVWISVVPSELNNSLTRNAILNGVEIMKMVDFVVSNGCSKNKRKPIAILVGSIVGGFAFFCLLAIAILLMLRYRKQKRKPKPAESMGWTPVRVNGGSSHSRLSEGTSLALRIPFDEIQVATNNFDKNLIIGSGGFGKVYKGVLKNNIKVAVKRGMPESRQGLPEFQSEVTVLSKIRHRHLVSLVGYCEEQSEMILVYEYMEKGPLRNHLYGSRLAPLSWKQRLEICIGAARGLHYLHTGSAQGIIHRDIKSTNILLDENYVSKVADFGLSRSGPCLEETHVSTGVKGSFGYLDPEYFRRQQLTDKSDVYSFGVVLFEVVCARPAIDPLLEREQVNLAEWATEWQKKGLLDQIIDPHLLGKIKPSSLQKFGETAVMCVAEYGVDRPTMGDVLWNLEYALQLQETGKLREPHEDSSVSAPSIPAPRFFPLVPSGNGGTQGDDGDGSSDVTTSQVFSQLMNNDDGR